MKLKITKISAAIFFASLLGMFIFSEQTKAQEVCFFALVISGLVANLIYLLTPKQMNLK